MKIAAGISGVRRYRSCHPDVVGRSWRAGGCCVFGGRCVGWCVGAGAEEGAAAGTVPFGSRRAPQCPVTAAAPLHARAGEEVVNELSFRRAFAGTTSASGAEVPSLNEFFSQPKEIKKRPPKSNVNT